MFPGGETETSKVEFVSIFGAFADIVFGAIEVHPGSVVDGGGGAGDHFESVEFGGRFFDPVDIVPVEDESLFGEILESGGVLKEHISPHGGAPTCGDHLVDEGGEVVLVEPGFFVGFVRINGLASHAFSTARAFTELSGFVAADVDDFGFERGDGFGDDVLTKRDEFGTGWASLKSGKGFFAEYSAFFAVEEAFEMPEKVDERDDLEGGEFALEALDLSGGNNALTVVPGGGGVGESVFEIEAEGGVTGVLGGGCVLVKMVEGGGLLSGEVNHPDSVHGSQDTMFKTTGFLDDGNLTTPPDPTGPPPQTWGGNISNFCGLRPA